MKLLAIDTASARCSAALVHDGALLERAVDTARDHAALVLPMIDELLAEAGFGLRSLDGIAFGRGPGSFTGVRVAAAVTQGLAAGADLPVLGVSDLRALALQARRIAPAASDGVLLAAMDARMGEVYWGVFDARGELPGNAIPEPPWAGEAVGAPDAVPDRLRGRIAAAAGRGLGAYPGLAQRLGIAARAVLADAEPRAADVARLAQADLQAGVPWQDAATAQPHYLRDEVAHVRR